MYRASNPAERWIEFNESQSVLQCVPADLRESPLIIAIADELASICGGLPGQYLLRARQMLSESFFHMDA